MKVLIAGTFMDLMAHRETVQNVCHHLGVTPIVFEKRNYSASPIRGCNAMVDEADVFVGIVGFRYGSVPQGQEKSFTHLEWERAISRDIPILIYVLSDEHAIRSKDIDMDSIAIKKIKEFRHELSVQGFVKYVNSVDDLRRNVTNDLSRVIEEKMNIRSQLKAMLLFPFNNKKTELERVLYRIFQKHKIELIGVDDFPLGAMLANAVTESIKSADFIIADVSTGDLNIFFEIGYAHALKKPTLILADESRRDLIPTNLSGYNFLLYDISNLLSIEYNLDKYIEMITRRSK